MTIKIPQAGGVPGISGPPNWFSSANNGFYLDDVRWRGAAQRTSTGGAAGNGMLRAIQAVESGQQYIYLSFRATFAESIADQHDFVYFGIQKHGTTAGMCVQMQAHPLGAASAGGYTSGAIPVPLNPPGPVGSVGGGAVQVSLRPALAGQAWLLGTPNPAWIPLNTRFWLQKPGDVVGDSNHRWAVQVRIPANAVGGITDAAGPNLGTDFDMWYAITCTNSMGQRVIIADYRTDGLLTSKQDLDDSKFPFPTAWDEFQLTAGPDSFGGVTIYGNGYSDVAVWNAAHGEGTTIANGAQNVYIARPRNYRPAGQTIPTGNINATFRIANWGSVAGDPNTVNWGSGTWDYIFGNDATHPVGNISQIPTLAALANPPTAASAALEPINLVVPPGGGVDHIGSDLPPGKSLHQCVLVTLSGNNLNFLCDSVFKNMNFDSASLIDREAEINIIGLKAFSSQPRDVYLALEKINMEQNTPGADEGKFLEASRKRLIAKGGPLADKLKKVDASLKGAGEAGSGIRLSNLLDELQSGLLSGDGGNQEPQAFISALGRWLTAVKANDAAAKRLAPVFEKVAAWLNASDNEGTAKATELIVQLSQWLLGLNNDPDSMQLLPGVLRLWASYLEHVEGDASLGDAIGKFFRWASGNRNPAELPGLLDGLRKALSTPQSSKLKAVVANFAIGVAKWLKGAERIDVLVEALADADLTEEEVDQLFPTLRIHVYHDTGERFTGTDGKQHEVLRAQSSFGVYAYHEGSLEGWQTSIQGARRLSERLYVLPVPNDGTAKIRTKVQAVEKGDQRIPDDPIRPPTEDQTPPKPGCWGMITGLFGKKA